MSTGHEAAAVVLRRLRESRGWSWSDLARGLRDTARQRGVTALANRQVSSRAHRVRMELLRAASITDAIYDAGFNSNGRFYASAPEILGMTPTQYRAGGEGIVIQYCLAHGSAGTTIVALASKGVCYVAVADDDDGAVRGLRAVFPSADLVAVPSGPLAQRAWQTISAIDASATNQGLPADIRKTVLDFIIREAFGNVVVLSRANQVRVRCGNAG